MPKRKEVLLTGNYYHVISRGTDKRNIFIEDKDYKRFIATLAYYRFENPPVKLSRYYELPEILKLDILEQLRKQSSIISLNAYCLMPNHIHLLLHQEQEEGIRMYMHRSLDSYTRYFNTKYKRKGTLVEGVFKAIAITSDEELLHVSRYIHLNPYSSQLTPTIDECLAYPFSTSRYYVEDIPAHSWINTTYLKGMFATPEKHKEFITNQADYQRTLDIVKHT
jgi:putative transposase